ncbi:hypothetical protein [Nocardioides sp. Leaf307]|uniref:hypothetical protein n=1 Tax=Nocardioides sp. Leaf307 TaxID=1736331 RepID=UPI0007039426|nr:hypothetical protein [Nocardioides sp. Leaf307]
MQALLRYWPLAVALALGGAGLGALAGSAQSATYTAESRVAVGYGDLSAGAIAGFPLAAGELASNYARYVSDQGVSGAGFAGVAISGSPIPDSNVIRIIAASADRDAALEAVEATAEDLVTTVNNTSASAPTRLIEQYRRLAQASAEASDALDAAQRALAGARSAGASSPARLQQLRGQVVDAQTAAAEADLEARGVEAQYLSSGDISEAADLVVVNPGAVTGDDSTSQVQRYGLLGLVLGAALALVAAVLLDRRRAEAEPRRGRASEGGHAGA